jgi:hypothetical protein
VCHAAPAPRLGLAPEQPSDDGANEAGAPRQGKPAAAAFLPVVELRPHGSKYPLEGVGILANGEPGKTYGPAAHTRLPSPGEKAGEPGSPKKRRYACPHTSKRVVEPITSANTSARLGPPREQPSDEGACQLSVSIEARVFKPPRVRNTVRGLRRRGLTLVTTPTRGARKIPSSPGLLRPAIQESRRGRTAVPPIVLGDPRVAVALSNAGRSGPVRPRSAKPSPPLLVRSLPARAAARRRGRHFLQVLTPPDLHWAAGFFILLAGVIATGAAFASCFALGRGRSCTATLSPHTSRRGVWARCGYRRGWES